MIENLHYRILYIERMLTTMNKRYFNILRLIYEKRCRNILEVGVYKGMNAIQMIETARIFHNSSKINYIGFDLFETATKSMLDKEFTKAQPYNYSTVNNFLNTTNSNIFLYEGNTKDTLKNFSFNEEIDFIYIDGGHSFATIENDWNYLKELMSKKTVVLFDDYFYNPIWEIGNIGCQEIINSLDRSKYNIEILEPIDIQKLQNFHLKAAMVKVKLR